MSIEKLRTAYAAATDSQWAYDGDGRLYGTDEDGESYLVCDVVGASEFGVNEQDVKNAEFIALAHEMMPQLLLAVAFLKETVHALETPGDFDEAGLVDTRLDAGAFLAELEALEEA